MSNIQKKIVKDSVRMRITFVKNLGKRPIKKPLPDGNVGLRPKKRENSYPAFFMLKSQLTIKC